MIKHIFSDIDGVITGGILNENFPFPSSEVALAIKKIKESGVGITLCTAKPLFSTKKILSSLDLPGMHIADGGAVISDYNGNILDIQNINPSIVKELSKKCFGKKKYICLYSKDNYFFDKKQKFEITKKAQYDHQQEAVFVDDLALVSEDIVKIIVAFEKVDDTGEILDHFKPMVNEINYEASTHPILPSTLFVIITKKGVSKRSASEKVANHYNLSFEESLGIGDSLGDWSFMELCKYRGTLQNAQKELKDLVLSDKNRYGFIGGDVNQDGIIDIFNNFKLI
ncbi:MAG: HAD hydrolase family protein [Candidatus Pacebacteria bacterium]|nr:HAD hydrolase family protein [Candidatus Paceibacterota bacterium]